MTTHGRMWVMRVVLGWVGAAVILAGVIVGGVLVANATVFSASGFVRDYLGALARGHVDEVLALPGVDSRGLDEGLLDARAYAPAASAEVVGETVRGDVHEVRVAVRGGGVRGEAVLEVERIGTRFLLFPEWGFASSPVTAIAVTTTGDARFTAGDVPLAAPDGGPVVYAALTPAVYVLGHESQFLEAEPVTVLATGADAAVTLDIRPNSVFEAIVRDQVDADLAACTAQGVLFPAGCPFGHAIENRVVSEPLWTIAEPPTVTLVPSDVFGVWEVRGTDAVARLEVDVQSLFDGTVAPLTQDVPFAVAYAVAFDGTTVVLTSPRLPAG